MKRISALLAALALGLSGVCTAARPDIKCGPWIQNAGETEVTILWTSQENVFAWVEVAPDDGTAFEACARPRYYHTVSGRRISGTTHSVRITGLLPGQTYRYRIYGKLVKDDSDPYGVDFGLAHRLKFGGDGVFKTLDKDARTCRFVMLNDIHGNTDRYRALTQGVDTLDLLIMNGDMVSYISDIETALSSVFGTVPELVADVPSVWVRGNHETRGRDAAAMKQYAPTPTGEPYHLLRQGPVAILILDAGEDKPDRNAEYSGMADFDSYRMEELQWLKQAVADPLFSEAPVKVAVMHIPSIGRADSWYGQKWVSEHFVPVLNQAGVDIMLSGHHHRHIYVKPGECGNAFPILANDDTDRLEFEADVNGYVIHTYNTEGVQTSFYASEKSY
ncbi:MAG: metallophosphoesterase [Bacteroidales bacterium]|nr:metallophosphoesterase [Bacteroidales bacterium]